MSTSTQQKGGVPVMVLKEGSQRTTGADARRSNIMAAKYYQQASVQGAWIKCSLMPSETLQ